MRQPSSFVGIRLPSLSRATSVDSVRRPILVRYLVLAVIGGVLVGSSVGAQPDISMIDLGTLGGTTSRVTAMNNAGQAAGVSEASGPSHAFSWTPGTGMIDTGLGGEDPAVNGAGQVVGGLPSGCGAHAAVWTVATGTVDLGTLGGCSSFARAINDSGQVAGFSGLAGDAESHAFLWDPATGMTDLGNLGGGYAEPSEKAALSNTGQVVGSADTAAGDYRAFSWTSATGMIDLGTLGGSSSTALGVNDAGQVIGTASTASNEDHAFLWTAATGMTNLGTLGGSYSQANAINSGGRVVGLASTSGTSHNHAFLWTPETGMVDLTPGASYSEAVAISDGGRVVGWISNAAGNLYHPFSWTQEDGIVDLPTLGGAAMPVAVNDSGQVAGYSGTGAGETHAVVWQIYSTGGNNTPVGSNVSVQPTDTASGAAPVLLSFTSVTQTGTTTLTTSSSGPAPPAGFALGDPPVYYELATNAAYAPPLTVCINYSGASFTGEPGLFHFEAGSWVDRTSSVDTASEVVCAAVDSLSPFVVLQRLNQLTALTPARVWLGLRNSDDVGTKFDLLAEVLKNGAVVGSGQLNGVAGGSSGFNNAVLRTIDLTLNQSVLLDQGATFSVRLSVRIAQNVAGHRSGTARLWFNDPLANSQFGATVGGATNAYFLVGGAMPASFALSTSTGSGPRRFADVFVDRAVGGNPFKALGTWSVVMP